MADSVNHRLPDFTGSASRAHSTRNFQKLKNPIFPETGISDTIHFLEMSES